jgi:hypothetical protein
MLYSENETNIKFLFHPLISRCIVGNMADFVACRILVGKLHGETTHFMKLWVDITSKCML